MWRQVAFFSLLHPHLPTYTLRGQKSLTSTQAERGLMDGWVQSGPLCVGVGCAGWDVRLWGVTEPAFLSSC